jgi:hypothetical protein
MTQQTSTTPHPFSPQPGSLVKLRTSPETGVVVSSDEWFDSLRIRGVAAQEQVLVEWQIDGRATRLWERTSHLEDAPAPVLSPPTAALPVLAPDAGERGATLP